MQEHFGKNMNLARINLMALLLHALCVVQTVSLHKLADAMPQHYVLSVSLFIIFSYKMFFGLQVTPEMLSRMKIVHYRIGTSI